MLAVQNVTVAFGAVVALDRVSFEVAAGEIVGLIGPNGAGKTTLFNCLSRLYVPLAGDLLIEGRSVCRMPPHALVSLGLARTFQNVALFDRLSVRDNVKVGGHAHGSAGFAAGLLRTAGSAAEEARADADATMLLTELDLVSVADESSGSLPFPLRKRVELARALAARPRLLLLDEPAGGLNHGDVEALGTLLRRLRAERALTILLVEHHMGLVMSISDRVVVLDHGRVIAEGTPDDVRRKPEVIRAYLGEARP